MTTYLNQKIACLYPFKHIVNSMPFCDWHHIYPLEIPYADMIAFKATVVLPFTIIRKYQ